MPYKALADRLASPFTDMLNQIAADNRPCAVRAGAPAPLWLDSPAAERACHLLSRLSRIFAARAQAKQLPDSTEVWIPKAASYMPGAKRCEPPPCAGVAPQRAPRLLPRLSLAVYRGIAFRLHSSQRGALAGSRIARWCRASSYTTPPRWVAHPAPMTARRAGVVIGAASYLFSFVRAVPRELLPPILAPPSLRRL